MSRRILLLSFALLLVAGALNASETPWFDMANCSMCKNLYAQEGLIDHIMWEQHAISDGVVSVTTVEPAYLAKYRTAHIDMLAAGKKMQGGEMMPMCGSCMALGACMMKGLQMEYVETSAGDVMIMTSDNPELVKEVQAWATRNTDEMKKMMNSPKS